MTRSISIVNSSAEINKTVSSCVDDSEQWKQVRHHVLILGSGALICTGTIGNLASLFVLRQKAYKNNVISGALSYLAVLDTLILWTAVFKMFYEGLVDQLKDDEPLYVCVGMTMSTALLSSFDNWLLVFITLTRVVHIRFPFQAQTFCSKMNYYGLLTLMHVFIFICIIPPILLTAPRVVNNEANEDCTTILLRDVTMLLRVLYLMVNFLIPASLLIFLNLIITKELRVMKARQCRLASSIRTTSFSEVIQSSQASVQKDHESMMDESQNADFHNQLEPFSDWEGEEARLTGTSVSRTSLNTIRHVRTSKDFASSGRKASRFSQGKNAEVRHSQTFPGSQRHSQGHQHTSSFSRPSQVGWVTIRTSQVPHPDTDTSTFPNGVQTNQFKARSGSAPETSLNHTEQSCFNTFLPVSTWQEPIEIGLSNSSTETLNISHRVPDTRRPTHVSQKHHGSTSIDSRLQSLTRILLIANSVFLFLNIPYWIFHLLFLNELYADSNIGCFYRDMLFNIFILIRWSNHSVNFYFYCATGNRFRQELCSFLRCGK